MANVDLFNPPIPDHNEIFIWDHLNGASKGLALASAMEKNKGPMLVIVPDNLYVSHLLEEISFFNGSNNLLLYFPDWETLPYDHFSPHQDIISERLATLYHLPTLKKGIVVTTIATLMHRLPPKNYLDANSFILKVKDKLNPDELRKKLNNAGYHVVSQVREHGEFAFRGSLIDLYPMGSKTPYRIDLFDEEVDSIRIFSPDSQRSSEKKEEINLLPAKEFPIIEESIDYFRQKWRSQFPGNPLKSPIYQDISEGICSPGIEYYLPLFFEKTATLFDYLPNETSIILMDDVNVKAIDFHHEITSRYERGKFDTTHPLLNPSQLFLTLDDIDNLISTYSQIHINPHNNKIKGKVYLFPTEKPHHFDVQQKPNAVLESLKAFMANNNERILFCAETLGRREVFLQLLKNIDLHPPFFHSWQSFLTSNAQIGIVVAPLEEGFSLSNPRLTVLPETILYGKRIMQRRLRKKTVQDADAIFRDLSELKVDDPVVHIDHGVGRYRGLQVLKFGEQMGEFLTLEYQDGDKLYVPVSALHLISRYSGTDPDQTPINKLGTDNWQRAKRRAANKVRDVAVELLDLYAKRASRPGFKYEIPQEQYATFAASFPFEETPDQLQAIEQVFADMTSDKPMDRVICGDVGFGKTEVALRASFLASQNSRQVAILVPTTLLAQQHFENFRDRFADWPIVIEMISRFRTGKEQKHILQRLEEGKIDIVIGTHKLLQPDIKFKSLGLVIIDEEHRFGVKQKEKLKALRAYVDILTLTATPIPRTLNMALSGIRDLSVIATPPLRRLSVKTFVHEYQDAVIEEAVQREILRGGQVYFLHNEVATINKKAEEIAALIPEVRITVAHGQMHERDLERIMSQFYHRHFNVLVCSTIIESGIDIPTANTIIINRADKFGLAQLHQLRGRVGRSHHQAYAYLLTPPRSYITDDAAKRLDAISTLDELGIGFTLATHDLEIRGAGELLGEEQSGDIEEIGFTLYMDLLSRAVDSLKAGKEPNLENSLSENTIEIDLHVTALIPENYLNDVALRLQFYKRIANAKDQQELDDIQVDMIDRFGLLPPPLKKLIAVTELKQKANRLGIIKIDVNEKGGKIEFNDKPNINPENLIYLIQNQQKMFRLEGPKRLRLTFENHDIEERIGIVDKILNQLCE